MVDFIEMAACTLGSVVQAISGRVSVMLVRHFVNSKWFGCLSVELKNHSIKI